MPGTRIGGLKTAQTNKERHGEDFYRKLGSLGGKTARKINPETGKALKGFALNRELASKAGSTGGRISRRGKANQ